MDKDKMQALKQIMQTNKMAFDYNYTMMMSAYEQNKLMFHMFLNQSTDGIPAETKSAIEEWLQAYRKGCDDLKRMTDEGYRLVEKSMSSMEKI
jgi:predicted outer membrane protein